MAQSSTKTNLDTFRIQDFTGGWNIRDADTELKPSETPDCYNVTLDEKGAVGSRLGYQKYNGSVYPGGVVSNTFYWQTGQNQVTQAGAALYLDTTTVAFKTFSTSARVGFADFGGKLFIIHPVDGVWQSDGTAGGTSAVAGSPNGSCLLPWQNRLWAAGDTANPSRLYGSKLADGTTWGTGAGGITNDLREKDNELLVALAGAAGIDIAGRPGMLVFKKRSTYRVYDATAGAYQTIDAQVGAASALAVVTPPRTGRTICIGEQGIFWTDGVGPFRPASLSIDPLFQPDQVAYDQLSLWCAGWKGNRVYFSLPRAGQTSNNLALEYHPLEGWIVPSSNAMSCYATYQKVTQKLYGGSPTVSGQAYELLKTGADDGSAVTGYFQTRPFEVADGFKFRMRRLRVNGRGTWTLGERRDYSTADDNTAAVAITGTGYLYDDPSSTYDGSAVYGPLKSQNYQDFYSRGTAKAIAYRMEFTSSSSTTVTSILGTGTVEVGSCGMYGIDVLYVPLGLA